MTRAQHKNGKLQRLLNTKTVALQPQGRSFDLFTKLLWLCDKLTASESNMHAGVVAYMKAAREKNQSSHLQRFFPDKRHLICLRLSLPLPSDDQPSAARLRWCAARISLSKVMCDWLHVKVMFRVWCKCFWQVTVTSTNAFLYKISAEKSLNMCRSLASEPACCQWWIPHWNTRNILLKRAKSIF